MGKGMSHGVTLKLTSAWSVHGASSDRCVRRRGWNRLVDYQTLPWGYVRDLVTDPGEISLRIRTSTNIL